MVENFLARYGYLDDEHPRPDGRERDPRTGAIETYQQFNGIEVTGMQERTAVHGAFSEWNDKGLIRFRHQASLHQQTPDVILSWRAGTEDLDSPMSGVMLAHSDFSPSHPSCNLATSHVPKPIHFNEAQTWSTEPGVFGVDVGSVALHEIGHIIGLIHLSEPSSVMYASLGYGVIKNELTLCCGG